MNADKSTLFSLICVCLCSPVVLSLLSGCGSPSSANITLRKENQDLRGKIEQLEQARLTDATTIRSFEQQKGTLPTLPQDRLEKLFTTHSIEIGRLSGGARINRDAPADDCIKVHVVPLDQDGDAVKSSGSVVVEAFDLNADPEHRQVGRWEFSSDDLRKTWVGRLLMYNYVLTCPLSEPPRHSLITVNATFTDTLTQRTYTAQRAVKLTLPAGPTTGPTSSAVTER